MKETGIEELRRVVAAAGYTREGAVDEFSAEEVLRLFRAIWASGWEVFPDQLSGEERRYGARCGILSQECLARLEKGRV